MGDNKEADLVTAVLLYATRCLAEGVLTSVHDANIGSIFGIGFPAWTGGAMQFIYGTGVEAFLQRANKLAEKYGMGFTLDEAVIATINKQLKNLHTAAHA